MSFPDAAFESRTVQLQRGDRLILFSDGVEDALHGRENPNHVTFASTIAPIAHMPVNELVRKLDDDIIQSCGGRRPLDDITLLAVNIAA